MQSIREEEDGATEVSDPCLLVYTLVTTWLGATTSRGMETLRGTFLVVVNLVKGHVFPTKTFLEFEFLLFKLDLTFLDWTSTLFYSLLRGVREILSFFVLLEGFDPLALVEGFTPVEYNKGLLDALGVLSDDVTVSTN
ncbi:hypothetical protein Tco_1215531 [Tanacetum coccineum]